jgi:FMN-dependent NADH-azoreductase
MKNALHIISSARGAQSYSTGLSAAIIRKLSGKNEIQSVVERDLTKTFPPFINEMALAELYKFSPAISEENQHLFQYSDAIFNEIKNADVIVIGTPMHNLGISSPLKAWIDQLIRFGKTYTYDNNGSRKGLLAGKKVYLAIASGGRSSQWPDGYEFIESYVKAVLHSYAGITEICTFRVEGTAERDFAVDYEKILQNL